MIFIILSCLKPWYSAKSLKMASALFSDSSRMAYDFSKADALWKELLLHQFHDILPGSSIKEVYEESKEEYQKQIEGVLDFLNGTLDPKYRLI